MKGISNFAEDLARAEMLALRRYEQEQVRLQLKKEYSREKEALERRRHEEKLQREKQEEQQREEAERQFMRQEDTKPAAQNPSPSSLPNASESLPSAEPQKKAMGAHGAGNTTEQVVEQGGGAQRGEEEKPLREDEEEEGGGGMRATSLPTEPGGGSNGKDQLKLTATATLSRESSPPSCAEPPGGKDQRQSPPQQQAAGQVVAAVSTNQKIPSQELSITLPAVPVPPAAAEAQGSQAKRPQELVEELLSSMFTPRTNFLRGAFSHQVHIGHQSCFTPRTPTHLPASLTYCCMCTGESH